MLSNSTVYALAEAIRQHQETTEKALDGFIFATKRNIEDALVKLDVEFRNSTAALKDAVQVLAIEGNGSNGEGANNG